MTKKFKLVLCYADENTLDETVYSDSLRDLYDVFECVSSKSSLQRSLFYKLNTDHTLIEEIVCESE